jgi:hypothetical protein
MTLLPLILPTRELAALTDPLQISRDLAGERARVPTLAGVLTEARKRIRREVAPFVRGRPRSRATDSVLWYWLVPSLLDHAGGHIRPTADWWPRHQDSKGMRGQLERLRSLVTRLEDYELPDVPVDLEEVLALIGVASPANCALRAAQQTWPDATPAQHLKVAAGMAWGFRSIFNGFEATHLVEQEDTNLGNSAHWLRALTYCARGNLQATLDEYLHVFAEWRGYANLNDDLSEAVDDLVAAMSLRSAVYAVRANESGTSVFKESSMRGRYAVRFGDQKSEEGGEDRAKAVALAFNSPFWPFVLTSTSIVAIQLVPLLLVRLV